MDDLEANPQTILPQRPLSVLLPCTDHRNGTIITDQRSSSSSINGTSTAKKQSLTVGCDSYWHNRLLGRITGIVKAGRKSDLWLILASLHLRIREISSWSTPSKQRTLPRELLEACAKHCIFLIRNQKDGGAGAIAVPYIQPRFDDCSSMNVGEDTSQSLASRANKIYAMELLKPWERCLPCYEIRRVVEVNVSCSTYLIMITDFILVLRL